MSRAPGRQDGQIRLERRDVEIGGRGLRELRWSAADGGRHCRGNQPLAGRADAEVERTLAAGLFKLRHEERYAIVHEFGSGKECLDVVGSWAGTEVPAGVTARLEHASGQATVEHDVRLRLFDRC